MKIKFIGEIVISMLLFVILILFINPFNLLMPHILHPFMVPFLMVLFIIFTAFLWKEMPGDEREQSHKLLASRFSYFAIMATLIFSVIFESFRGEVDPFLIISICIGLIVKIIGLIYSRVKL